MTGENQDHFGSRLFPTDTLFHPSRVPVLHRCWPSAGTDATGTKLPAGSRRYRGEVPRKPCHILKTVMASRLSSIW